MGKIKTRLLGLEEVEKKDKNEQKKRSEEKKVKKNKYENESKSESKNEVKVEDKDAAEKKLATPKTVKGESKPAKVHVRGNKYLKAKKLTDKTKLYKVSEALDLLKKIKFAKFDESVELHINVDETGIKGEVELPHSTGKTVIVKIVDDKFIEDLTAEKNVLTFDILVTHPSFMPRLAKFARILGPKGLMPNPKAGTISPTPELVAKKFLKGSLRYKTEPKAPIIHQIMGKSSYENKMLEENINAFIKAVGINHILSGYLKTTMSPSLKIDIKE